MQAKLSEVFNLVGQSNNEAIKKGEQLLYFLKKEINYPL